MLFLRQAAPRPGEQPVIGADDGFGRPAHDQNPPVGPDAGIHHHNVDGPLAEGADSSIQSQRAGHDVLWINLVGYIHNLGIGADCRNRAAFISATYASRRPKSEVRVMTGRRPMARGYERLMLRSTFGLPC